MGWTDVPGLVALVVVLVNQLRDTRRATIDDLDGRLKRAGEDVAKLERVIHRLLNLVQGCNRCRPRAQAVLMEGDHDEH